MKNTLFVCVAISIYIGQSLSRAVNNKGSVNEQNDKVCNGCDHIQGIEVYDDFGLKIVVGEEANTDGDKMKPKSNKQNDKIIVPNEVKDYDEFDIKEIHEKRNTRSLLQYPWDAFPEPRIIIPFATQGPTDVLPDLDDKNFEAIEE